MTGGAASGRKGSAYERELVSRFDAAGWGALRLPASGSATTRELPDVLAGTPDEARSTAFEQNVPGYLWAIELKCGQATTLYVDAEEVAALEAFAQQWGAQPFLGARFTTQGSATETYLVPPERARGATDAGRYGLPVADVAERAAVVVGDGGVVRRG